ncbi:MAG: single-stranded-DNA-specific exonuclease RecJ [Chitinophagaceae bacterium]
MHKRWTLSAEDGHVVAQLRQDLKIHPALCRILSIRGVQSFQQAQLFFRPDLNQLHDPFLMKDMEKAVIRILHAIDQNEKILIYGDYDVDGTTSVGCMYHFLSGIYTKENIDYYIPHRYREGYGISKQGIEYAIQTKANLVISLDCGIKSADLIQQAKENGIDFIVCDHHIPGDIIPPALAILNPKQKDCNYPYKDLCGCGVGFKLITALAMKRGLSEDQYFCYLDLVATAIAADIVPLTGENRVISFFGLKKANENPSISIQAIMNVCGAKEKIQIQHLVFMVAPRVNAAGRMDDARKAVDLFIENDLTSAMKMAESLNADNIDRKELDASITKEAIDMLDTLSANKRSTILYQPHWHKGVIGIVASRLIDRQYRPTILLTKSGDIVTGSARSIIGFNIYDGLEKCKDLLIGFGGHYFAAGLTMAEENIIEFTEKFEEVVVSTTEEKFFIPSILIDAELKLEDCSMSLYNIIKQMEPFGPENPQPVFVAKKVRDTGNSKLLKDQHIKFQIQQGNVKISGIGFNMSQQFHIVRSGLPFDIIFTLEENIWQGITSIQVKVIDIRYDGMEISKAPAIQN